MTGRVYRIHDLDAPARDEELGALSLGEVEDHLDAFVPSASNEAWEATLKAGDDIYVFVDGVGTVYWGSCRDHVRDAYNADIAGLVDHDDWFDQFDQFESDFD